ncbi:something about silencing protein 10 [Spea bombifrons]|uniref:something about silencing protein 10 n=1 Tax=Spea bombifrons TaxID=233779 RepID=UPI002348F663|nr:something about silencing protein 10 [Spea bombifrons]
MGKFRRSQRLQKPKADQKVYDESLANADIPSTEDINSDYFNDDVEKFHEQKFQRLIKEGMNLESDEEPIDSEEEVMPLDIVDDEDEEDQEEEEADDHGSMASDLEDRRDDGLPDELAWGQKKKIYYDTDYTEKKNKKVKKSKEELEAEAEEEEEEAQNIQRRLANNLNEEDYGLDLIQEFGEKLPEEKKSEEKIVKDLDKMTEKEKRKLLKKESPELLELIQDLKLKLAEVKNDLDPLIQMVKDGSIQGKGSAYLQTKYQLYLNYCTNISFYLLLKAKRIPIQGHPVIERLVAYRNLINDLGIVDERLSGQIHLLLNQDLEENESAEENSASLPKASKKPVKKTPVLDAPSDEDSDLDEESALKFYKEMETKLQNKRKRASDDAVVADLPSEDIDPNAKRGITYQIAKNKGLTPKRKKIDRNPRVKHREKFRRAKIRRKGQVREVRKEETRYSGELSGIRAGVKKSIKLK